MDDLVERLARKLAAHTSRRRLLGMLGTALLGGVALPLLPVARIARSAEAADLTNEPGDQMSCDYWRYCGFDGNLCGCCGGTLSQIVLRDRSSRRPDGSAPACIRSTARITSSPIETVAEKSIAAAARVMATRGPSLFTAPSSTTK